MSLDLTKSQIDSQLSNADIYPEATKLSIAKVLLEWNQNNNVRKSASNTFHCVCFDIIYAIYDNRIFLNLLHSINKFRFLFRW